MSSTNMADLPAATPPPGFTQDLENPPELKHINAGITISIVGMVVSTLFILLRVYTKAYLSHIFGIDDGAVLQSDNRDTADHSCSRHVDSLGESDQMSFIHAVANLRADDLNSPSNNGCL